jgi:hypothetical protein
MTACNTLDDFPADTFRIVVYCDTCDHSGPLDRSRVPEGMTVQQIVRSRRCSRSGSREPSIRIVYTGAGGFHYGG